MHTVIEIGDSDPDSDIDSNSDVTNDYNIEILENILEQHSAKLLYLYMCKIDEIEYVENEIIKQYNKIHNDLTHLIKTKTELTKEINDYKKNTNKYGIIMSLTSKLLDKLNNNITNKENNLTELIKCKDILKNISILSVRDFYYVKECNKHYVILQETNQLKILRETVRELVNMIICKDNDIIYLEDNSNKLDNYDSKNYDKITITQYNVLKSNKSNLVPNIGDYAKIVICPQEFIQHDAIVKIYNKDLEAGLLLCRIEYIACNLCKGNIDCVHINDIKIKIGSYLEITYEEIFYFISI